VEVYNEAGCMGMSDEVFVMYVGIAEFGQGELKLFPVPVDGNGVLNIGGVNVNNLTNLEIMDASGRMVWSSAKGVSQIALNGLAAGNYVFRAFQNNDIVFIQFVIE
ncbi:MAG: T9SS type A sorting domain-containing protein, partial [Flavobacteriales bacterium]|nr:T9SS type A sorting domain-containing protein [Flavobacteriales bacterium]